MAPLFSFSVHIFEYILDLVMDSKGWSQNRVKIFYLYNVKIEGGRGSEDFHP